MLEVDYIADYSGDLISDNGFRVGDLVTRDGTDVQRVVDIDSPGGDIIQVECIRAPSSGWCEVGEREHNLTRRYEPAGQVYENE